MAAAVGRFGENKNILINVKFDRYKKNNKDINQSTITWTFGPAQMRRSETTESYQARNFLSDSS